jgi:hypothetical protein
LAAIVSAPSQRVCDAGELNDAKRRKRYEVGSRVADAQSAVDFRGSFGRLVAD